MTYELKATLAEMDEMDTNTLGNTAVDIIDYSVGYGRLEGTDDVDTVVDMGGGDEFFTTADGEDIRIWRQPEGYYTWEVN